MLVILGYYNDTVQRHEQRCCWNGALEKLNIIIIISPLYHDVDGLPRRYFPSTDQILFEWTVLCEQPAPTNVLSRVSFSHCHIDTGQSYQGQHWFDPFLKVLRIYNARC